MSPDDFDAKEFALLADFSEEDCEALVEFLEPKKVAKGRKLFREGSEAEGLVLLASGAVEIAGKRTGETAQLGPGAAIGALSMLAVGTREATVSTVEACQIWELRREDWHRLVDDYPRTACRLAEAIVLQSAGLLREAVDAFAEEG